jgi:hypothetical protein
MAESVWDRWSGVRDKPSAFSHEQHCSERLAGSYYYVGWRFTNNETLAADEYRGEVDQAFAEMGTLPRGNPRIW